MATDARDATAETVDAVSRFNDAFNRHDVDAIMAHMTDNCIFESTSPPDGQIFSGQAAVRATWEDLFRSSPTAHFEGEEVIASGDRCVVLWRYTWTGEDGAVQHIRGVDILRVRDGKVAEKRAYVKG